jgi:ActR/RegA family two-component response regulator
MARDVFYSRRLYSILAMMEAAMADQNTQDTADTTTGLTFEKVWAMFQETDRRMKETARALEEGDRRLQKEMGFLSRKFGTVKIDIPDNFKPREW